MDDIESLQALLLWGLGLVFAVLSLILGVLLAMPSKLRREFMPREAIELRLAENDRVHVELNHGFTALRTKLEEATLAIHGHAHKEVVQLTEHTRALEAILIELKKANESRPSS
jgi:Na+-transporting methylmalonyl-CoA/oxaloacetate decarboxylase gamma subunit